MNEHLKPVFETILPGINSAGIKYWVYGGVAIASVVGNFFRENNDVDIFVREEDYNSAKETIEKLASKNGWRTKSASNPKIDNRPKTELFIPSRKEEVLSLIPAYIIDDKIRFKFWNCKDGRDFPIYILQQVKKNIDDFIFFTPPNEFIKKLFIVYLETRKSLRSRQRLDAEKILTREELARYYPKQ